jgi:Ca2+-transporting ATPase
LTDIEVKASREKFGNNEQIHKQKIQMVASTLTFKRTDVVVIDRRSIIYFILGQNNEVFMLLP